MSGLISVSPAPDYDFAREDVKDWSHWSDTDSETFDPEDTKLMRRIDWRLLPWMCILYALSLIDRYGLLALRKSDHRNNIGAANIAGMETELKMGYNNSYSISLFVFFPGYFTLHALSS
jgi:hypothetical protein